MKISLEITKIIGISESPKLHKFFIFLSQQTNFTVIISDFPTDFGEDAACQDRELSEWGGDNILIATPGAGRSRAAVITSQKQIHACYITYES